MDALEILLGPGVKVDIKAKDRAESRPVVIINSVDEFWSGSNLLRILAGCHANDPLEVARQMALTAEPDLHRHLSQ